jgi:hypothetical protein
MKTIGYKQKTKLLGIPVIDYGDKLRPELEMLKYTIIENMLVAGLRGAASAVFDEGDMNIVRGEDGKYRVTLAVTGDSPSATGTVGGAYFAARSSVSWEGLEEGSSYFLYIKGTPKTFLEPSEVRTVASPRRLLDKGSVLVARVDLQGDRPSLDRSPDGKAHAKDVVRHVLGQANPHGEKLVQDKLLVKKTMAFDNAVVLEFGADGGPVRFKANEIVAALKGIAGRTRKVVDFASAGPKGVVLSGGGRVSFVAVSRRSKGKPDAVPSEWSKKTGEVFVGYFGEDAAAKSSDQFVVRNDGEAGAPMRALVFCE